MINMKAEQRELSIEELLIISGGADDKKEDTDEKKKAELDKASIKKDNGGGGSPSPAPGPSLPPSLPVQITRFNVGGNTLTGVRINTSKNTDLSLGSDFKGTVGGQITVRF